MLAPHYDLKGKRNFTTLVALELLFGILHNNKQSLTNLNAVCTVYGYI